jgi:zinc/manganese transport system ATP-binding protein
MVRLDNLTVSYRRHPALHHVSGEFAVGSLTAVMGPNGSGKSTLLKSIIGLLPVDSGHIEVSAPRLRIAYLPQLAEMDKSFPLDVGDCVSLGCWPKQGAWGRVAPVEQQAIDDALCAVGLEGFESRPISSLSTGQLQRVLFARLLLQDADLILLDEPFNAMDSKTTTALLGLVSLWHSQGRTIICVLHDSTQALEFFPQTLMLAREVVAWGPTAQALDTVNLNKARAMSQAWDETAEVCTIEPSATSQTLQNLNANVDQTAQRKLHSHPTHHTHKETA